MKKNYILLLLILLPVCLLAQSKSTKTKSTKTTTTPKRLCEFEKLFSLKPGMDMPATIALVSQYSKLTLLSQTSEKLKPYESGGDSILHEVIEYRIDSSVCLLGRDDLVKFEFADGVLYKAYMESSFGKNEFADLMSNFDLLHTQILKSWKYEKKLTISGGNVSGLAYNFYKTLDKTAKLDMCQLQYVKTDSRNPDRNLYKLEVLWVNLNNTRMENSSY